MSAEMLEIVQPGYWFHLPGDFVETDPATRAWSLRQFEWRDLAMSVSTYVRPLSFEGRLGLEASVGAALAERLDTAELTVLHDDEARRDVVATESRGDPTVLRVIALRVDGGVAMLEMVQPLGLQSDEVMSAIASSLGRD